jgi:hypothetical protein
MFKPKFLKNLFFTVFAITCLSLTSCSSDDDDNSSQDVVVSVNGMILFDDGDDFNGDVDGDFSGNGGSESRMFMWQNSLNTAEYNADITATAEGLFRMVVNDADENIVLDKMLNGASEPDSFSGVTSSGTPGIWTVTITLTSFDGDGSFSLSQGD